MSAEIEVGCHFGGPEVWGPFDVVKFGLCNRLASGFPIQGLDARIKTLAFLLRVDGSLRGFQGDPVENVKVATKRDYISVDFLIKRAEWEGRTVQQITATFVDRVRQVPGVLGSYPKTRKLVTASLLRTELEPYCQRMLTAAAALPPWAHWVPGVGVVADDSPGGTSGFQ